MPVGASPVLPATPFPYHRGVAPIMWVMFGLILVETAVVHILVALWWPGLALILSLLSLATLVWLASFIRSLARRPVLLGGGHLVWRCGHMRSLDVPLTQVAGIRPDWDHALVKARDSFNGALAAYPNIVVDLRAPVRMGRRDIHRLAHRLDDPQAFAAALTGLLRGA